MDNNDVPDETRQEAMLRVLAKARNEVIYNYEEYGIAPPIKTNPDINSLSGRCTATALLARLILSVAASSIGYLNINDDWHPLPDLRTFNIRFKDYDGNEVARFRMRKACSSDI